MNLKSAISINADFYRVKNTKKTANRGIRPQSLGEVWGKPEFIFIGSYGKP
jgi:hypothetical protein